MKQETINKLKELGYFQNALMPEYFKKHLNDYCNLVVELETDNEYVKIHGGVHSAYVESIFTIHNQRIINEIQSAYDKLQDDLKALQ